MQELEDRCLGKAARQYGCTQQLQQEKQEALVGMKTTPVKTERNRAGARPKPQLCFPVTMQGSRRDSFQTERVGSSAPEEASLRCQRGGASAGATKSGFSGRLQPSLPAELAWRPAVSTSSPLQFHQLIILIAPDEIFDPVVFSRPPRLQGAGRDRLLRGQNESAAGRDQVGVAFIR